MNSASVGARSRPRLLTGELAAPTLATVALVVLASLLLVMQTSRVTTMGYKIRDLQILRENWRRLVYQEEAQVAALQSLGRIEREAKAKFKMISPTSYIYIIVDRTPEQNAPEAPTVGDR